MVVAPMPTTLSSVGSQAFSVAGPQACNQLPTNGLCRDFQAPSKTGLVEASE